MIASYVSVSVSDAPAGCGGKSRASITLTAAPVMTIRTVLTVSGIYVLYEIPGPRHRRAQLLVYRLQFR